MGKPRFTEEFKIDAIKQITERGYSRRVVGWSMQSRQTTELVIQALLMAVWRRKPKNRVLIHSDQGSQFTSIEWSSFLKHQNLEHSPLVL